jgi:hypothetical protein
MALINKLKAIANAIRSKTNKSEEMTLEQMASEISMLGGDGLDFEGVFNQEQSNEINQYYKNGIAYAKEIKKNWSSIDKNKLIYLPEIDLSNVTSISNLCNGCRLLQIIHPINSSSVVTANNAFYQCSSLLSLNITLTNATTLSQLANQCSSLKMVVINAPNNTNLFQAFQSCYNLSEIVLGDMRKVTNYQQAFENTAIKSINLSTDNAITLYRTFYTCGNIESITLTSIKNLTTGNALDLTFAACINLITLKFSEWLKYNISLSYSANLSTESIDYIIENAIDKVDGATDRTLQLHATAGANWDANSKYQGEERNLILTQKGIEVTW